MMMEFVRDVAAFTSVMMFVASMSIVVMAL